MGIRIIADSTCDIDPTLAEGLDLTILPLTITVGDQNFLDTEDIDVAAVYEYMRQGIVPKTAQIPYERAYGLFRTLLEEGSDVIYISFSSELSGCYAMAEMIARELREEYPGRKIAIVDSRGGSGATGLIVLQALKMADSGWSFETVLSEIAFMAEHIEHVFSVDDLEWLAKGGRVPRVVGYLGSKLGLRPILDVEKGRMVVCRMVRGKANALRAVADEIIKRAAKFPAQLISITHADDILAAQKLGELIGAALPKCRVTMCHIGGVLGVHIGLKGIGAFCLNEAPEHYSFA